MLGPCCHVLMRLRGLPVAKSSILSILPFLGKRPNPEVRMQCFVRNVRPSNRYLLAAAALDERSNDMDEAMPCAEKDIFAQHVLQPFLATGL